MTDKERYGFDVEREMRHLKRIIGKNNTLTISNRFTRYLIEQAERVQELEEEKERWQSGRNVAVATKMKMDDLEKQLEKMRQNFFEAHELYLGIAQNEGDLLKQNKRYREAIEGIQSWVIKSDVDLVLRLHRIHVITDKALEESE